ncbi:hypothetical protein Pmi06nite_17170 [Planotetraspora mira]|uniref:Uncharacterized protein n=1 Tax=Planotetraspora mira TaxID=58121 RepID=A0A8J3TW50_9ACTN|nr:hypothetical protein Pmi06nite_17170 [Planotetraspora mira]
MREVVQYGFSYASIGGTSDRGVVRTVGPSEEGKEEHLIIHYQASEVRYMRYFKYAYMSDKGSERFDRTPDLILSPANCLR